jgi:hypothetical protein
MGRGLPSANKRHSRSSRMRAVSRLSAIPPETSTQNRSLPSETGAIDSSPALRQDRSNVIAGKLTMGWLTKYPRKATIEINHVAESEAPLDKGAGLDWTGVGKSAESLHRRFISDPAAKNPRKQSAKVSHTFRRFHAQDSPHPSLARRRLWPSSDGNFALSARAPLSKCLCQNRCIVFFVKCKEVTAKVHRRLGCRSRI